MEEDLEQEMMKQRWKLMHKTRNRLEVAYAAMSMARREGGWSEERSDAVEGAKECFQEYLEDVISGRENNSSKTI